MKFKLKITMMGCLAFVLMFGTGWTGAKKFHPRNIKLIKQGLIPPMKFFPEVPRITAEEALALYYSGKGFFVAIGGDSKVMNGGILLHDYMKFDPRRLKQLKGKVIVLYCG